VRTDATAGAAAEGCLEMIPRLSEQGPIGTIKSIPRERDAPSGQGPNGTTCWENPRLGVHAPQCDAYHGSNIRSSHNKHDGQLVSSDASIAAADSMEALPSTSHADAPRDASAAEYEEEQTVRREQAHITTATTGITRTAEIVPPLSLSGYLNGHPTDMLIDSGAAANLIHPDFARRMGIRVERSRFEGNIGRRLEEKL